MTNPLAEEDIPVKERLKAAHRNLSIRQLSNLTGVSFGSIQGILSGRIKAPRELTLERLEAGLEQFPFTIQTERAVTWAYDRASWSAADLQNIVPPRGAQNYRVVYYASGTESPFASTDWRSLADSNPLDAVHAIGATPRNVARVVFDKP